MTCYDVFVNEIGPAHIILKEGRSIFEYPGGNMFAVKTQHDHIAFNDADVPIIAGTTMKVTQLVLEKTAYGWSPEELHFQHPHLTLGHIYAALAYYWDHQVELDQMIEDRLKRVDNMRQTPGASPLAATLRTKGLI